MSEPGPAQYANLFRVGFNALEFVIDFGQSGPQWPEDLFHTRIVTAPGYAKALAELMGSAVEQFEEQHGEVRLDDSVPPGSEDNS